MGIQSVCTQLYIHDYYSVDMYVKMQLRTGGEDGSDKGQRNVCLSVLQFIV
jgi:hypothetical protein